MTRISDRLLVQRMDDVIDVIVVIDESSGVEIAFPVEDIAGRVATAIAYFTGGTYLPPPASLPGEAT